MQEKMAVLHALGDDGAEPALSPTARRRTRAALASLSALQLTGGRSVISQLQDIDQRDIEPCEGMLEVCNCRCVMGLLNAASGV